MAEEPRDVRTAMLRGWRGRCPACGEGALMDGYLTVRDACPACGTELHHHRADDGPAWATILIAGKILAPLMLFVFVTWRPEGWVMALGFSVAFVGFCLALLPRLKGVFVGVQWAKRMHGFDGKTPDLSRTLRVSEPAAAPPIRDAASIILLRRGVAGPQVLMGQRGAAAAFMPDKFVFPGGAIEAGDLELAHSGALDPATARGLAVDAPEAVARALPLAAIRELWEETGLRLGTADPGAAAMAEAAPPAWRGFLAGGLRPRTEALRFVFRAITPPGRPRRFDARFFLAEAEALDGDPGGLTAGDAELRHLQWIDLAAARALGVLFITTIVLSEIEAALADPAAPRPTPYFRHDDRGSHFRMIGP